MLETAAKVHDTETVQTWQSEQFGALRTTVSQQGKIYFALTDVAKTLELQTNKLKNRLNSRGWNTIPTPTTNQHGAVVMQQMTYIDEPNLYRCIFQSRKPEATKFQDWVFEEVLPAIRQSGGYLAQTEQDTPETIMARALKVADQTLASYAQRINQQQGTIEAQSQQLKLQAPKVEYVDQVLNASGTYTSTQVAKELGITSAQTLHKMLKERKLMFNQSGQWHLMAKFTPLGYTKTRTCVFVDTKGQEHSTQTTVWTERGRAWLHSLFGQPLEGGLFSNASAKGGAQ